MKNYYLTIILLFVSTFCFSQKEKIKELEATLGQKNGVEFITDANTLSDLYYAEGMYDKAEMRAEDAYEKAKEIGGNGQMALALNKLAKATMKIANGKKAYLNRAYKNFEESNEYTSDNELRIDNLENMKTLAAMLSRPKDVKKAVYLLAVIRGENPAPIEEDERTGLFNNRKKRALEEYQKVQAEKQNLATQKETLTDELSELSEEQESMRRQQETLINLLEIKESAIIDMSEEQMKKELLLSEQERLLDSLTFINILDSLELSQKEMKVQQQNLELKEQMAELQLQKSQRNLILAFAGIFVIAAAGLFHRYHVMKGHNMVLAEKNKIIQEERERSEELLLNILPKAVAEELKLSGGAETQHYENATVMFVDFKGFSKISKLLTPAQLVSDLDYAFRNFDAIIGKYGLEKIKTIGDAYMCAGGLPNEDKSHPVNVIKAAIEMQAFLNKWNAEKANNNEPIFEARIGIHTGPLVAGVVGSKKFAYDIWGDTVNVASRMETSCEVGKVNISNATFERVKNNFKCEYRGKVPAKNVGEVEMYYVEHTN